jgi:hypothetical protein
MLHNNLLAPKETMNKAMGAPTAAAGVSSSTIVDNSAAAAPKPPKQAKLGQITKSLEAGSSLAAPNTLTGGAALGKESLEKTTAIKPPKVKNTPGSPHGQVILKPGTAPKTGRVIVKSEAYERAEDDYAKWEKREEFETFMKSRMPHMTKSEIKAFGQAMLLNKSMRLEKKLDFATIMEIDKK